MQQPLPDIQDQVMKTLRIAEQVRKVPPSPVLRARILIGWEEQAAGDGPAFLSLNRIGGFVAALVVALNVLTFAFAGGSGGAAPPADDRTAELARQYFPISASAFPDRR